MKQVLIHRGQATVANVPAPLIEDGHILVEVAYSLISAGTEVSSVEDSGKSLANRALEQPDRVGKLMAHLRQQGIQKTLAKVRGKLDAESPTGYSCSGTVIQIGPHVEGVRAGDRVACAGAGIANHAEIVLVPSHLLVPVPDGCDLKAAASVTLGAIAMQGVRRADPRLGEVIAVIGLGLLGQITVQLLTAAGCRVIGIDLDPRRVALARQLGSEAGLDPSQVEVENEMQHLTGGQGADATIITAASPSDAIAQRAMKITRKKGRVVVVGDVGLGLERSPFYEKEIDFLISCSYGPGRYDPQYEEQGTDYPYAYVRWTENRNMAEYLRLIAEGKLQLGPILEREYDISQASEAYATLQAGADKPLGVLLRYPIPNESSRRTKLETKVVLRAEPTKDRINVAVIGAGNFAKGMHLPNLQQLADLYHLRAIVSATGSNARSMAQTYNADYASTDYEDVLSDPNVDAVLIATRHHLHAGQVVAALKAGKHVFCEKPLALDEEQLSDILACYNLCLSDFDNGAGTVVDTAPWPILMVGFNRRFSPAALRMREIVSGRQNPFMALYRVNAGYLPPQFWVHGPEGGGRVMGEACHMIDLFTFLAGAPIESVSAEALAPATAHVLATDNVSITVRYLDGSLCTLFYTALGASDLRKEYLEVYVDGKVLVLDDFQTLTVKGAVAKGWNSQQQVKGHFQALRVFADSIRNSPRQWPIPLSELVDVTRAAIAAAACAARTGKYTQSIFASRVPDAGLTREGLRK